MENVIHDLTSAVIIRHSSVDLSIYDACESLILFEAMMNCIHDKSHISVLFYKFTGFAHE